MKADSSPRTTHTGKRAESASETACTRPATLQTIRSEGGENSSATRKASAGAGRELHNAAPCGLQRHEGRHSAVMIVQVLDFHEFLAAQVFSNPVQRHISRALARDPAGLPTKLSTSAVDCVGLFATSSARMARSRNPWSIIARPERPASADVLAIERARLFSIIQAAGWPIWPL